MIYVPARLKDATSLQISLANHKVTSTFPVLLLTYALTALGAASGNERWPSVSARSLLDKPNDACTEFSASLINLYTYLVLQ